MEKIGQIPSNQEIEALIKEVDANNNGKIEFSEFEVLLEMIKSNKYAESVGGIAKLLKVVDLNIFYLTNYSSS